MDMITGLLLALAPRTPKAANDINPEGQKFPPNLRKTPPAKSNVVRSIKIVAVAMAVCGLALIGFGNTSWSFDPATGLKIQTASSVTTRLVGV
jgi:hypothetical protein